MAAYFDGDGVGEFHLDTFTFPGSNCMSSPAAVFGATPVVVAYNRLAQVPCGPPLIFCEHFSVAPQPSVIRPPVAAITTEATLREEPRRKTTPVRWADEQHGKTSLQVTELSEVAASEFPASPISHRVWQLSQDAQGTFEVQRILKACSTEEERGALAAELRGHVLEAVQCPHANHVLQQVIALMPASSLDFVVCELTSAGPRGITKIARHRFGCRIVEGLLVHCATAPMAAMVAALLAEVPSLSTHKYGNFVVQKLLEHAEFVQRGRLLQKIHANLATIVADFYGAAVVSKAIAQGTNAERLALARGVTAVRGLLAAFAHSRHGGPTVGLLLATLEGSEKQDAVRQLRDPPLKMCKCGPSC